MIVRNSLKPLFAIAIFLFCSVLFAQDNALIPGQKQAVRPVVTFELNWAQADPHWYKISIESDGPASYQSQPKADSPQTEGDPYVVRFVASEPTRTKVFQLARELNFFSGNFESKLKVARTGDKTMSYKDDARDNHTTLNYSDNQKMNELISIFQKISTTFETSRRLDYDLRFDKLGLDRDLKSLEELNKSNHLLELQVISPTLERIATDSSVMNITRQKARRLMNSVTAQNGTL